MGLNDELYATMRTQILALDLLPPLDKIFNMTQQVEAHKQVMINRDIKNEASMVFAAKEHTSMVEKGGCKICRRYGNDEANCYEAIR